MKHLLTILFVFALNFALFSQTISYPGETLINTGIFGTQLQCIDQLPNGDFKLFFTTSDPKVSSVLSFNDNGAHLSTQNQTTGTDSYSVQNNTVVNNTTNALVFNIPTSITALYDAKYVDIRKDGTSGWHVAALLKNSIDSMYVFDLSTSLNIVNKRSMKNLAPDGGGNQYYFMSNTFGYFYGIQKIIGFDSEVSYHQVWSYSNLSGLKFFQDFRPIALPCGTEIYSSNYYDKYEFSFQDRNDRVITNINTIGLFNGTIFVPKSSFKTIDHYHRYDSYANFPNIQTVVDEYTLYENTSQVGSITQSGTGSAKFIHASAPGLNTTYNLPSYVPNTVLPYLDSDGNLILWWQNSNGEIMYFKKVLAQQPPLSACQGNLLLNPSFESNLNNWSGSGGEVVILATDVAHGSKSAKICNTGNSLRQTVAGSAGKKYTLRYKLKTATSNSDTQIGLKFLTASFQPIATKYDTVTSPFGFVGKSVVATAPAGAAFIEVSIKKLGAGCIIIDDLCLSSISLDPCAPDVTPPIIANCPTNINKITTGQSTSVTWTAPTATDNCTGFVNLGSTKSNGANFLVGNTTVIYEATDQAGNTATCSFVVTVTSPGSSICSNNLLNNPSFENELNGWVQSGATGISGGAYEGNYHGELYNNTGYIRQTVPVQGGKTYSFSAYTLNGNAILKIKYLNASYSVLTQLTKTFLPTTSYSQSSMTLEAPIGTALAEVSLIKISNFSYYYFDALCFSEVAPSNNTCSLDVTPPVIAGCPSNITQTSSTLFTLVSWTEPTVSDNCTALPTLTSNFNGAGSNFPLGTTQVVYTANDLANNVKTCSFTVTINPQSPITYCPSAAQAPWSEWISSVKLGSTVKNSEKSTYSNFTSTSFTIARGISTPFELVAKYSFATSDEYLKIWIDFNRNGIFEEDSEVMVKQILTKPTAASGATKTFLSNFYVGEGSTLGPTRMRVSMKRGSFATPCEVLPFGEVEDYTINIAAAVVSSQLQVSPIAPEEIEIPDFTVFPNPAGDEVSVHLRPWSGKSVRLSIINQLGKEEEFKEISLVDETLVNFNLSGYMNGLYIIKLECLGYRPVFKKLIVGRGY